MNRSATVFLMYHEIEIPGRPTCHKEPGYLRYVLQRADFREQMYALKKDGWHGMNTSEALAQYKLPGVAITFDDGCETDLIEAAPLLKELGFQATFYITVGFLDRGGFLSRSQLQALSNLGFEIGCHSLTHAYLTDLAEAELRREIEQAKHQLEQIIGRPVEHYSCPGGRFDARVQKLAHEAGYRSLATSQPVANSADVNPYAIGRVAILRGTRLQSFHRLASGNDLWKIRLADSARTATRNVLGNSLYDRIRAGLLERPNS